MAKKELTVDEHNANVFAEIKELEAKLAKLKTQVKSEAQKPQATLQECIAMNKKAAKLSPVVEKSKPNTKSL
jgi:hypothetical protein